MKGLLTTCALITIGALSLQNTATARSEGRAGLFKTLKENKKNGASSTKETKPLVRPPSAAELSKRYTKLTGSNMWTNIPSRAILHVPPGLKSMVGNNSRGDLVGWETFLNKNRSKIHCYTVTLKQVRGRDRFTEETLRSFHQTGKIVVATYQNRPITVTSLTMTPPPKPKEAKK